MVHGRKGHPLTLMVLGTHKTFRVEVLTPLGRIVRTDASSAVFPATDGEIGVLPSRAPLIAMLGAGRLLLETPDGESEVFHVSGGFVHVRENVMTVLAEECHSLPDIDPEEAWEHLQDARKLPARSDEEFAARQEAIAIARTRFGLVQKMRRKERPAESSEPTDRLSQGDGGSGGASFD